MKKSLILSVFAVMFCACGSGHTSGSVSDASASDTASKAFKWKPSERKPKWIMASAAETEEGEFSMRIMDVFSITGKGVVMTGRIDSGVIEVGDTVCVPLESGQQTAREVVGIEMFRKLLKYANAGQNVGILIDEIDRKLILKGGSLHSDCTLEEATENEQNNTRGTDNLTAHNR
ncbi:MAG: hypothetical protein KJO80_13175 [Gammaproteobacteria bacterium]|nr:hypothetical protein [Gammaproteobacteria bacterium]